MIEKQKKQTFDVERTKARIEELLAAYRAKKEEMVWADDDWEVGEIQEELDIYADKIRRLKAQVREYEHEHEQQS